jgi:hypothetical protein
MPRHYALELRRTVIELIDSGRSLAKVAELVEPSATTIYIWRNLHLIETGQMPGTPSLENAELISARRGITELDED